MKKGEGGSCKCPALHSHHFPSLTGTVKFRRTWRITLECWGPGCCPNVLQRKQVSIQQHIHIPHGHLSHTVAVSCHHTHTSFTHRWSTYENQGSPKQLQLWCVEAVVSEFMPVLCLKGFVSVVDPKCFVSVDGQPSICQRTLCPAYKILDILIFFLSRVSNIQMFYFNL